MYPKIMNKKASDIIKFNKEFKVLSKIILLFFKLLEINVARKNRILEITKPCI